MIVFALSFPDYVTIGCGLVLGGILGYIVYEWYTEPPILLPGEHEDRYSIVPGLDRYGRKLPPRKLTPEEIEQEKIAKEERERKLKEEQEKEEPQEYDWTVDRKPDYVVRRTGRRLVKKTKIKKK